ALTDRPALVRNVVPRYIADAPLGRASVPVRPRCSHVGRRRSRAVRVCSGEAAPPARAAIEVGRGGCSPVDLQQSLTDLLIVSLIAALTPILAGLLSRLRVPQVVILIVGGILVGPQVLAWAQPEGIELISNVGLGFLFLLAGYELELALFRERARRLALAALLLPSASA